MHQFVSVFRTGVLIILSIGVCFNVSAATTIARTGNTSYRPPSCDAIVNQEKLLVGYTCPGQITNQRKLRLWVPLQKIDHALQRYVVILEDGKFYQHNGFDTEEMLSALKHDIKVGKFARGGSTITQQLAKNLFLTKEKTLWRKIEEVPRTMELEKNLTKSQILELYFNTIEWGPGIYGIEAATRTYFNKPASQLNEFERWMLATMIPNPKELNLWVQPKGKASMIKRGRRLARRLGKKHLMPEYEQFLMQWQKKKPKCPWERFLSPIPTDVATESQDHSANPADAEETTPSSFTKVNYPIFYRDLGFQYLGSNFEKQLEQSTQEALISNCRK